MRVSKFLSVIFMKPFGDMIQASSCRFFHVLLKIQITEQFSAFEDVGLRGAEPGAAAGWVCLAAARR